MPQINQNKDQMDEKAICEALLRCEHEDEVIKLLDELGYSLEQTGMWHYLGDNAGNFSSIGNQQADASAALVEKLVNSTDAVLLEECHKHGINPESDEAPKTMAEAVEKFFGVKDGRLDFIDAKQQTELAERIRFMVTGDKSSPCINIVDSGEGQTPNSFKKTFLSTTSVSQKIKINFVQGKFNAGSTGSFQFCGKQNVQLIISKRSGNCPVKEDDDSNECWGFTVIRRKRPTSGEKFSAYVYLAPDNEILRFKADELNVMPTKSAVKKPGQPYSLPIKSGSVVKLFNYNWKGRSIATTDGRRYLEKFLQAPCLPFRIHETRAYSANYYDTTVVGVLNKIQGDDVDDDKGQVEKGFPADVMVSINDIGTIKLRIVVWKDEVSERDVPRGVFFLVNGQVLADLGKDFVSRRTKHDYIAKDVFIAVDCTGVHPDIQEDTFMSSRDRLRNNDYTTLLKNKITEEIKDHPGLKHLNAYRKQKLREEALENQDNVLNIFNEMMQNDPSLSAVLGLGGQVSGGVGPGEPEKFEGKKFPSYFRLAENQKNGMIKNCPLNKTISIVCETDADNDYFFRSNEPGELDVEPSMDLIESSRLWNGRFNIKFRAPWNAKVGDVIEVRMLVSDNINVAKPFEINFKIKATAAVENIKPPKPKPDNPPHHHDDDNPVIKHPKFSLPQPIAVSKKDWHKCGFEDVTDALRIKNSEEGYDFYWNSDNKYLINETSSNKQADVELLKQWFKWGLTIAAMGLIKKQKEDLKGDDEEIDLEPICEACDGLAMVIIPIIRTLHDMPLSKV